MTQTLCRMEKDKNSATNDKVSHVDQATEISRNRRNEITHQRESENPETSILIQGVGSSKNSQPSMLEILLAHKMEVLMLLIMSVVWPSCDIVSDLLLVADLVLRRELKYAACLLAPQIVNITLTALLWRRLEPKEHRSWSWILVALQAWPQFFALRTIWTMLQGKEEWKDFKLVLQNQIGTLEPYTESLPCVYILITLWVYEATVKENDKWGTKGNGRNSYSYKIFYASSVISILSANFGIVKFFKNGPVRFLPTTGLLDGFLAPKTLLTFLSVISLNILKIATLALFLRTRVAERLLHSVSGGECRAVTLFYQSTSWERELFYFTETVHAPRLFEVFTQVGGKYGKSKDSCLAYEVIEDSWFEPFNSTCLQYSADDDQLKNCTKPLPTGAFLLCGNWFERADMFSNLLVWLAIFVLPHIILSLLALKRLSCKSFTFLLVNHPQTVLSSAFSHFVFATEEDSPKRISLSPRLTWANYALHLICTMAVLPLLLPIFGNGDILSFHRTHRTVIIWTIVFHILSPISLAIVLHKPFKAARVRNTYHFKFQK